MNLCAAAGEDVKESDPELYRLLLRVNDEISNLVAYCEQQAGGHKA